MPTTTDELDRMDICLRILDGLTKTFKNLDEMFDELTTLAGKDGVSERDSDLYASHCQLLSDLHTLVVKDLTALRNDIVCQCGEDD